MTRDVVAAQRMLARILTDAPFRRAWEQDPSGVAARHLSGSAEIDMVAGLSAPGISAAALHLDMKRILERPRSPAGLTVPPEPQRPASVPQSCGALIAAPPGPTGMPPVGLGFWPDFFDVIGNERGAVDVWEHRIDDCLKEDFMEQVRKTSVHAAVVFHSVDLSLGSPEATTDGALLDRMRAVLRAADAQVLSDHLGFTRVAGRALGHFEPVWRVEESLRLIACNIERLQDTLGVRVGVENIASAFDMGGEMSVAEFLNELVRRTGCAILLDISNLTLSDRNGFWDASAELAKLSLQAVVGVHLAGGAEVDGFAYDAHAFPIPDEDIAWLERLIPNMPNCRSVVIERDSRRDAISELRHDLRRVRAVMPQEADGRERVYDRRA